MNTAREGCREGRSTTAEGADHWMNLDHVSLSTACPPTISLITMKPGSIASFPLFRKLPVELQDMVWSYALQHPRVFTAINRKDDQDLVGMT
jgi:hypothetical protein